jgi:hypothetical protein
MKKKQASTEWHAKYREENREKRRQWHRDWVANNKVKYDQMRQNYRDKVKRECFLHYGGGKIACVKCGFDDYDCLVLDHVNDDGASHRKSLSVSCRGNGGGIRIYEALFARKMPNDPLLQLLCANCNMKKQMLSIRNKTAARKRDNQSAS